MVDVDVVLIGLGPGGEAAAQKLAEAGLSVVGIDDGLVGGECPYYGCVPSKMMVRAADALAEGRRVPRLAGDATVTPSFDPVATRIRDEATDDWDDTAAVERLSKAGVTVVRGRGRLTGANLVEVDSRQFRAGKGVVLNTGTDPAVPPVEGLADMPFWTNRDMVKATAVPASLVVLGGGAIGCELALVSARFGARVTVVEAADRLLANEEPETSAVIEKVFVHAGIRVLTGAQADRVTYADGTFTLAAGGEAITAERLLVATGRTPQLRGIGLETVGVEEGVKALETDERMRVLRDGQPVEGLFAIGDITGKGAYTHVSMYQSRIVVDHLLGKDGPGADYRAVPRVTFTDPEVGSVGMTEHQAREQGLDVRTSCVDLAGSARGWLQHVGNEGLIKLVVADDELVGATSVGPMGGEVLSMLTTAIHARVPVTTLRSMIYAYPTYHRAVQDALTGLDRAAPA